MSVDISILTYGDRLTKRPIIICSERTLGEMKSRAVMVEKSPSMGPSTSITTSYQVVPSGIRQDPSELLYGFCPVRKNLITVAIFHKYIKGL